MDLKRNKTFKVFITLIVIIFIISVISCKEAPVAEEQVVEEQQQEEIKNDEVVIDSSETKEETKPVEEPAVDSTLEAILKEKVSFISEALPGAELNTKTGELTAKVGNEWGIKEGESIGWYVVKAFKMETADGVEEEQDAIGLIPPVIEAMQNKIFEEKEEYTLPLPIDFKESPGAKITELKITSPDFLSSATVLGINALPGTKVIAPIGGEWSSTSEDFYTKGETDDKIFFIYYNIDESNGGKYLVYFRNAEVLPEIKNTYKVDNSETGKEIVTYAHDVVFGEPFLNIIGDEFLDVAANKITDRRKFEKPGNYQLLIIAHLDSVNPGSNGESPNTERKTSKIFEVGQGEEQKMVFILNSFQKPANEQIN